MALITKKEANPLIQNLRIEILAYNYEGEPKYAHTGAGQAKA